MSTSSGRDHPSSAAADRGAIDQGKTGDKVSGFDPAAAPMEADAEAGGEATAPDMSSIPRGPSLTAQPLGVEVEPGFNAASHGSAMRRFDQDGSKSRGIPGWPIMIILAVVVIAAVLFLGIGWRMR
jgi:cobalamin biosynthesis Mg chelatase CobN